MDKDEAIALYKKLLLLEEASIDFKQMAMGSHIAPNYGWRTLSLKDNDVTIYLTLEKNPSGFSLYNDYYRFSLSDWEGMGLVNMLESFEVKYKEAFKKAGDAWDMTQDPINP